MMRDERSLILSTSVGVIFHTALLFAAFLFFAGHNAPGGGFIAGLVVGAALVLRYLEGGPQAVEGTRWRPGMLMGAGLGLAIATGAAGWLIGGSFLESGALSLDLPLLGTVKVTSALFFDGGVFLVVVGLTRTMLSVLGRDTAP
jgi:multicomponent Na+:H+ antiporter subunit A